MPPPTSTNPLQRLVEVASHDLKNPLSVILVNAAVLSRSGPLDDSRRIKAATRILSNVGRMNRMIGDLFDFAFARMGMPVPFRPSALNLGDLTAKAMDELRTSTPSRTLSLERSGELLVRFDQDRLLRGLQTMLTTAHKFGQPSEPVRIACAGVDDSEVEVVLEVGLNPAFGDYLARLLESTEAGGELDKDGLWIALSVLRQTISAHAGTLELMASSVGGIRFSLRLPRHPAEASK